MMVEEPSSREESSLTKIIDDVMGRLEPERSKIAVVPLKTREEIGKITSMAEEVSEDRGLEVEDRYAVEEDSGDKRVS